MKNLSLYIHIPFCISKCDYCDFFSCRCDLFNKKNEIPDSYIQSVCNEIDYRLQKIIYSDCESKIKTIYIGGGTPSLLNENQLKKIIDTIKKNIIFSDDYEFTIEVNPDDVDRHLIDVYQSNGINRISCGVQSFSDDVLKNVHRRSDKSQVLKAFDLLNKYWNKKLSIDLICGLPGENEKSLHESLDYLVKNKVSHISFYSLCIEDETPLGKMINNNQIKYDEDNTDDMWISGRDFLLKNGYLQYEISNFCLPQNECKHNMVYWQHKDYIGIGSGATGTYYFEDKNGEGFRYTNIKDINEYISFWQKNILTDENNIPCEKELITQNVSEFEYFMMGLRTNCGVSEVEYKKIFNQNIPKNITDLFYQWHKDNKCNILESQNDKKYILNQKGMLFLNLFLEQLMDITHY